MNTISEKDRIILRDLAKRQLELACSDTMKKLEKNWLANNMCRPNRPMVTIELGTFQNDVIPELLRCEGEQARKIETLLYSNMVNHTLFGDDTVVRDYIPVAWEKKFVPFGIEVTTEYAKEESLGYHFTEVIADLEKDFHKLGRSSYGVDKETTQRRMEFLSDVIGDILPVRLSGECLWAVLTQNIIHIMGMENFFMSMYDAPEKFHEMMAMQTQDYLDYFDYLEKENLLLPTTGSVPVYQGSYAYTDELPENGSKCGQMWLFMDSQETVGMSPDMFEEFIFPYYDRLAKHAGLVSYGCCEPVDPVWDNCLSKWENLRRVSISPWCNEEIMADRLKGAKVVYHRKPSPNFIGVGAVLDEAAVRESIGRTVSLNKGRSLEFTQRDVYTINKDVQKVKRYVEIIREECADKW